jgi:tetratricopeptide (TPR) repeat protein
MAQLLDFDSLWNFDDPARTEQRFRELLPTVETGDSTYHAALLTQIARAQGLQRQFAEAHRTLDQAQMFIHNQNTVPYLRYLLERGRVHNSSGHPQESRPLFIEAYERARDMREDFYAVDAAHMLGVIEPPEQQLEWNLKALELAEQSAQPRARQWLGSLYNNIGWSYHDLKQYNKALEIFEKALEHREQHRQPKPIRIARWCVGRALRSLGRIDEALAIQQALLNEMSAAGEQDGYVYEELGECLLLKGKAEAARHFQKAYDLLSREAWLAANETARLERLRELGESNSPA